MNKLRLYLLIALRNLVEQRRRTALLGVAIGAVTFLLVLILALTLGIEQNVVRAATTLISGHVNVTGFYKPTPSKAEPLVSQAGEVRQIVEEHTPGVTSVVDRTQGIATLISPSDSLFALMLGIDITEEANFTRVIDLAPTSEYIEGAPPGEFEGDLSKLSEPGTILIFASQARRLGLRVGDTLTARAETFEGTANTADLRIVAVARDMGLLTSFAAFVPKQALRELYRLNDDTTGVVMAYVDDSDEARAALGPLRAALGEAGFEVMPHSTDSVFRKLRAVESEGWTGQQLDLTTWKDQITFLDWILTAINTVSVLIVVVLLVIIGIGLINTMLIAIRERTGEIGTMRAMGGSRRAILGMFMVEAMALALVASSLGAGLATLVAAGINAAEIRVGIEAVQAILLSDEIYLAISFERVAIAIASITLYAGLVALWPALRAARMQPVDAIRHTA